MFLFFECDFFLHASSSLQVRRSECCGTGQQSMGVSAAQGVIESECNVETRDHVGWSLGYASQTSDSAKMTNQVARA